MGFFRYGWWYIRKLLSFSELSDWFHISGLVWSSIPLQSIDITSFLYSCTSNFPNETCLHKALAYEILSRKMFFKIPYNHVPVNSMKYLFKPAAIFFLHENLLLLQIFLKEMSSSELLNILIRLNHGKKSHDYKVFWKTLS